MKYKELWEQMCQRCDELDKKLADQEQPPIGFITNTRHRLNFEPNATGLKDMPKTIDWKIPVYVSPQPKQEQGEPVAWRPIETAPKDGSMLLVCLPRQMNIVVRAWYNRLHNFWQTDYEGEGGITRPTYFHEGDLWHPIPPLYTTPQQRTWVGLTDKDLAVCGDEDDVMLARYWERVCKEKNNA
jgi:hypothetical protein